MNHSVAFLVSLQEGEAYSQALTYVRQGGNVLVGILKQKRKKETTRMKIQIGVNKSTASMPLPVLETLRCYVSTIPIIGLLAEPKYHHTTPSSGPLAL